MKLVNLTNHDVTVLFDDGGSAVIPPSGIVARCEEITEIVGHLMVDGHQVPVIKKRFGEVKDLPEPETDTLYIVSALTAQAAVNRQDLIVPDSMVKDGNRLIGCRAFARIW